MTQTQIAQPSVSLTLTNADLTVQNTPQKVLVCGQQTAAASAVSGELQVNISSTDAPENALFGEDSQIAAMIRAFKKVNPVVQIDAIGLDDAAGTPRVVTFTVGGSPTAAGTITVSVGSEVNHKFVVAIATTDSATDISDAITVAVNLDAKVPFTCSNVAGKVDLDAVNDGTVANDLGVEVVIDAAGVTLAVGVTEETPGATDPTLTGVLDVATDRYQGVIWPFADTTELRAYLEPRFNVDNAVLDGVGFVTIQDDHATALTTLNARNQRTVQYFVDKNETESGFLGPAMNEASYVKSAIFAGIRALRLTPDTSISRFLVSSASLDQFGGPALASLPYFNTPVSDLPLIKSGRGWTDLEIEQLFDAGGSVMGNNLSGTGVLVGECVTTYKTDGASNPDVTFKFLNYVDTSSGIREYFFNNYKARYAQSRLTLGPVTRGRDMANESVIRVFTERLYQDLSQANFVLTQDGSDAATFFKENLNIVLDLSIGKVTITMLVPIVTQLRTIISTIKIAFSTS